MAYPHWLDTLAVISLAVAFFCSFIIILDLFGRPQHMWIMNVVWPVTALYFGPLALLAYFNWGRLSSHHAMMQAKQQGLEPPAKRKQFWQKCAIGTTHCGSGCTLADIVSEWVLFFFPLALFGHALFGSWVVDYLLAFLLGIAFQYFTIKPMRDVAPKRGLVMALKADSLSLTAWQLGMYGWMAIATFAIFGHELEKNHATFWFMMQIGMWCGFVTSYPVNWWLLKRGIKESM